MRLDDEIGSILDQCSIDACDVASRGRGLLNVIEAWKQVSPSIASASSRRASRSEGIIAVEAVNRFLGSLPRGPQS